MQKNSRLNLGANIHASLCQIDKRHQIGRWNQFWRTLIKYKSTPYIWDAMHQETSSIFISKKITCSRNVLSSIGVVMVIYMIYFLHMYSLILCVLVICLHQRSTLIKVILHCIPMYLHSKFCFLLTSTKYQWKFCIFQKISWKNFGYYFGLWYMGCVKFWYVVFPPILNTTMRNNKKKLLQQR